MENQAPKTTRKRTASAGKAKATASSTYVASIVALLQGENAEQKAQGIQYQLQIGLETQIQLKKGERADLKGNLNAANAAYEKALRNNGSEVTDRALSIGNILNARQAVEDAEEALEDHDKHVQWLKEAQEVIGVADEQ